MPTNDELAPDQAVTGQDAGVGREFYVDGVRVLLRERVPLKDAPNLLALIEQTAKNLRAVARLGVVSIEEWDFEGSPRDARAYEDLDFSSELMPISEGLGRYLVRGLDWQVQWDGNTVEINGKAVRFKDRVPLKLAADVPALLDKITTDLRAVGRVGLLLIEEWGFDGNPASTRGYDELDIPSEVLPLAQAIGEYVNRRRDSRTPAKN